MENGDHPFSSSEGWAMGSQCSEEAGSCPPSVIQTAQAMIIYLQQLIQLAVMTSQATSKCRQDEKFTKLENKNA